MAVGNPSLPSVAARLPVDNSQASSPPASLRLLAFFKCLMSYLASAVSNMPSVGLAGAHPSLSDDIVTLR